MWWFLVAGYVAFVVLLSIAGAVVFVRGARLPMTPARLLAGASAWVTMIALTVCFGLGATAAIVGRDWKAAAGAAGALLGAAACCRLLDQLFPAQPSPPEAAGSLAAAARSGTTPSPEYASEMALSGQPPAQAP